MWYTNCMEKKLCKLGVVLDGARRQRAEMVEMRLGTFAGYLGVSRQTLHSWLRGRGRPSKLALERMADVLTQPEMDAVRVALGEVVDEQASEAA